MLKSENPARERILRRVRSALTTQTPLRHSGPTGQIFAPFADPLERFRQQCTVNNTEFILTSDTTASAGKISEVLSSVPPGEIFLQDAPLLRRMAATWTDRNVRWSSEGPPNEPTRATITLAESLVAATGSVFVSASCGGRNATIVAPVHIVVATISQLTPTLDTALAGLRERGTTSRNSMVTLVTGPSRTGDIEKIIVMGAHGPQRLIVVLASSEQ